MMKKNWKKCPRYKAVLFDCHMANLTAEKMEEMRCEEIEQRLYYYKKEQYRKRKRDDVLQGYY